MVNSPPTRAAAPRARNLKTQAHVRRTIIWQIALPLGLAFMGAVVLGVLVSLPGGAATRSPWADVSLMLLIMPTVILGLLLLVVVGAAGYGLYRALPFVPIYAKIAQDFVAIVAYRVQAGANKVSGGVLSVRAALAAVQRTAAGLRSIFVK